MVWLADYRAGIAGFAVLIALVTVAFLGIPERPTEAGLSPSAEGLPAPPRAPASPSLARDAPVQPLPVQISVPPSVVESSAAPVALPEVEVTADLVPGVLPGLPIMINPESPSVGQAPAAPGEPLQKGRVVVRIRSSPLGAAIVVNGRTRGKTPVKLMLNPGRHVLKFKLGSSKGSIRRVFSADTELCLVQERGKLREITCSDYTKSY